MTTANDIKTDSKGTIRYYTDGYLHREDGPALIYANGTQMWYEHGYLHRADGPAVIWYDGRLAWWFNGTGYQSFNKWCNELNITDQQRTLLMLKYSIHT